MSGYKYISENTLCDISLHDCQVSKLYAKDGDLILEMEFMEIDSAHELNPFELAHQSGEGRIVFKNVKIAKCALDNYTLVKSIDDSAAVNFEDLTILDYDEEKRGGTYSAKMYSIFLPGEDWYGLTLEFSFEKSCAMWNEFRGVSWYENHSE